MFSDKEARQSIKTLEDKMQKLIDNVDKNYSLVQNDINDLADNQKKNNESILNQIEILKIDVQKDLVKFHKELTDRYFDTLERILRVHSESSLVTALAHQVNEKDLNNLKSALLQPFLEAKWAKEKEEKGQRILNNGETIIKEWERLHEEIITKERNGIDVSKEKVQWEVLNKIVTEIGA